MDKWDSRREMRRVSKEPETDKSTIEETLQSIDGTLKRIEELLSKENRIEIFGLDESEVLYERNSELELE